MVRRPWVLGVGLVAAGVLAYELGLKPWQRRWLAGPVDSARSLPGDSLVEDADYCQTMAVTINAPPSEIWPWLVQLGFGRAGWYSYDALDVRGRSSSRIRPELQSLEVGDSVPFAPGLGFRVEVLEPQRALVLFAASEGPADAPPASAPAGDDRETLGMGIVGRLSDANAGSFEMTWAFVLEPVEDRRTLLLERFRTRATPGPATAFVRPIVDHGHFLMTRKHLLGVKLRAEQTLDRAEEEP